MIDSFRYASFAQEIVFADHALDQLPALIEKRGWSRALLVTTHSQRVNGTVARVETLLGANLVGVFDATQPHVPQANVDATIALAQRHNADLLVALGGGSAIGVAKATSHHLQSQVSNLESPDSPALPILAIPTTYAGSEMTPVFGVTRVRDGVARKETTNDPRIVPQVVLYDPQLMLDLPRELTTSTGVNAFAHCVEAVYSITRNPLSSAAALRGGELIYRALPRCYANGQDLAARADMLTGAYLAGSALANVAMGLHHGVCHVLGGTLGIPHGVANAIVLPHVIRFNADVCRHELAGLARTLGSQAGEDEQTARAFADAVAEWIQGMGLPARLREVGVKESDLPLVAELAFKSKNVQNNPKKIQTLDEMLAFVRQLW